MKRNALFLALTALMVFSFGQVYGVESMDLDNVTGVFSGDTVMQNNLVKWTMRLIHTPGDGSKINGSTNGYGVWTHQNGVMTDNFSAITYDSLPCPNPVGWFMAYLGTGGLVFNLFSIDGLGVDTIGFGGVKGSAGQGLLDGSNANVWWIATTPNTDGDTLCIDSAFYPPGGEWLWATATGSVYPYWGGPYCYHVYFVPDLNWIFDDCPPGVLEKDHCAVAQVVLHAHDQDIDDPEPTATFTKVSGVGGIVVGPANTVTWSYSPSVDDVCDTFEVCIEVDDGMGGIPDTCCFKVHFTNNAPVLTCPDGALQIAAGTEYCRNVSATDDCDDMIFFLAGVDPVPGAGATYYVLQTSDTTAKVCFSCDPAELGLFTFTVGVTDGPDTSYCEVEFEQVSKFKWDVVIENVPMVIQGTHQKVAVTVTQGSEEMGGFDFLIAYDASGLNFIMAEPGPLYCPVPYEVPDTCNWEYFTYRYGAFGNCGNACPSGLLRVVGIAETNNGPVHPACFRLPVPYVLFWLDFLVTDDRTFECMFLPIRFFWMDCGDNTISSKSGDTLWVDSQIFDKGLPMPDPPGDIYYEITNHNADFPTYYGMPTDPCIDPTPDTVWIDEYTFFIKNPIRWINFWNGGIDIACAESLDARGDINLNGVPNEIADAVLFSNYFIYGLSVFHINPDGQIAATDVNADGMVLTVGDLVYQIRIIVGDAQPYPKLAPVEANYVVDDGVVSVDKLMGAALVVVEGNVTPTLLAENMDIKYAYNAEENVTRVLVYSFEGNGFEGEFLNANGDVVSIELGSYEGTVVKSTELPADFALNQNYPNPFNPATTISFNLPTRSEYTLTIYNVTGQVVTEFAGEAEAGVVEIDWDASMNASGIYFYKLTAGDFSATKKMVLLK